MLTAVLLTQWFFFQNQEIPRIDEQLRVQFVLVDVLVTDKKGELVSDLQQADFEVKDAGKKVNVTYFEILDYRQVPLSAEALEAPESRTLNPVQQFILALDLEAVQPKHVSNTFKQLRDFLDGLDRRYAYKINLYSMEKGSITKGFAYGIRPVLDALYDLEERTKSKYRPDDDGYGSRLLGDKDSDNSGGFGSGYQSPGMLIGENNTFSQFEDACRNCKSLYQYATVEQWDRCINETLLAYVTELELRTQRVLGQLELLTNDFKDDEGIKVMLLISPGFAVDSLSSLHELANAYRPPAARRQFMPGLRGRLRVEDHYNQVVHACTKNRVIFYTLDIFNTGQDFHRGISAEHGLGESQNTSFIYNAYNNEITSGLRDLAQDSGGSFTQSFGLGPALNQALNSNQFFYVLGYDSPEGKPGKFRQIKIKVNRKGLQLNFRRGYIGG